MKYDIQDVKGRLKQLNQDRNLTREQRRELYEDYKAEIDRRNAQLQKYIKESGIHPNLDTGR
jgi:ribosomal protein L19E